MMFFKLCRLYLTGIVLFSLFILFTFSLVILEIFFHYINDSKEEYDLIDNECFSIIFKFKRSKMFNNRNINSTLHNIQIFTLLSNYIHNDNIFFRTKLVKQYFIKNILPYVFENDYMINTGKNTTNIAQFQFDFRFVPMDKIKYNISLLFILTTFIAYDSCNMRKKLTKYGISDIAINTL